MLFSDESKRTISGIVVPIGASSNKNGVFWRFSRDAVTLANNAPLNNYHDGKQVVGHAVSTERTQDGLRATFSVVDGPVGDKALRDAASGLLDFSMEISNPSFRDEGGARLVDSVVAHAVALTGVPSFAGARIETVNFSIENEVESFEMTDENKETPVTPVAVNFDMAAFAAEMAKLIPAAPAAAAGPKLVPIGDGVTKNEPIYRFSGEPGAYDFSADLLAAGAKGDHEANERVQKFVEEKFAVATTDVNEANPTGYRPDMYVDNLNYDTPIWDAINKGSLDNITPFSFAKWNSASTVVSDHVEGTEPTLGAFALTGDTVTPTALSGKFEINREVWDQVGNPQISALIWAEIKRSYYEGLEVAAVAYLDSLSPTGITLTAGATDTVLEQSLTSQLGALNYIRGGNRFRDFFLQVDLHSALIAATDDVGRKLYPVIAPSNANGTVDPFFGAVNIGGLAGRPAWALAATGTTPASSYLFNRADIWGWATPPGRLDFDYQVKSLFVGVWGYKAFKNTRAAGLREVIYDPQA
jgi:hypothetical protein